MPVLYEIYNIFIKVNCLQGLCSGSATAWGFFSPNPGALDHVTQLVQLGKVTSNPSNIINYIKVMFMYPWTQHSFPKTSIKEKNKIGRNFIQSSHPEARSIICPFSPTSCLVMNIKQIITNSYLLYVR